MNDNDTWWKTSENLDLNPNHSTQQKDEVKNDIPSSLLTCSTIQNHESTRLMKVLMDSGGTHTMIHSRCLPVGAVPTLMNGTRLINTIAGTIPANRTVHLQNITLPEFDKSRKIDGVTAHVFDSDSQWDIIVGRDLLQK